MLLPPMMCRGSAIAALLLLSAPSTQAVAVTPSGNSAVLEKMKAKTDFMRAMKGTKAAGIRHSRNAESKARLRAKILSRARQSGTLDTQLSASLVNGRRLDEDDDQFGFDASQYSLFYSGCSAVATYSDDMAEDENYGYVVETNRFVIFRMCPTEYCSSGYKYGCGSGYGEYILEMDDYLQVMAEFKEEEMERYCDYCEQCMKQDEEAAEQDEEEDEEEEEEEEANDDGGQEEEEANDDGGQEEEEANDDGGNDGGRRRLDDAGDDAAGDDAAGDDAAGDDAAGDDAAGDDAAGDDAAGDDAAGDDDGNGHYCADYDACYNYANVCEAENDDGYVDFKDFFECAEVEGNNDDGNQYFLAPHCGSDRRTITIGLYKDEYCSSYVGNDMSIYDVTGFYIDEDALGDYYADDCISCNAADLPWQEDDENDDDNNGEVEVTEICQNLFEAAGKCHLHMEVDVDEDAYGYNQDANEQSVCNFIDNVVTGQYDEYGFIYLSSDEYSEGNRNNPNARVEEEITITQIFGLVVSVLACAILLIWACFLHRKLTRKAPWRPARGGAAAKAGKLSRQNSGIVMGRSRSGGSYHGGHMA